MNGKQTCGGGNWIKAICPHCGSRNFANPASSIVQDFLKEKSLLVLYCWSCRLDIDCDLSEQKEWYGCKPEDDKTHEIYECIYLPYNGEDMKKLMERYPQGRFEDASDYIHPERFTIQLTGVSLREFFKVMLQLGIHNACLGFMVSQGLHQKRNMVRSIIEELRKEHDPCIKEECWL